MKISRVFLVATVVVGCVFGLGWSALTATDRLAVRTKDAIDHQRWGELYEITKNPRGMTSPWGKATFVNFCRHYLGSNVRTKLEPLPEQATINFTKMWVVLLSTKSSVQTEEIVVFNDPVGGRWGREMMLFSNRWNLEAAMAQERLLALAASLKFPKADGDDMGTYEFLVCEREALRGIGMRSIRTVTAGSSSISLDDGIKAWRADLISVGRKEEVAQIESRHSKRL